MPAEVMENWLCSSRYAQLNGTRLRPIEHPILKGTPLSVAKGQSEVYPMVSDNNQRWMLKKLHKGKSLDRGYLATVNSVLPKTEAFRVGTTRKILSSKDLRQVPNSYYARDFADWLNTTILMPAVEGGDWAALADEIRDGNRQLERSQRIELARNLAEVVLALEHHKCSHRDLSSGNVFIVVNTWRIYLIDFDSLYHPSLPMPGATTCGTDGYAAPYAWDGDRLNPGRTWCRCADRYALAIIIVEFLTLYRRATMTGEGGMFDQDELRKRYGHGLNRVRKILKDWPGVLDLFNAAISSTNFNSCPSPKDWQQMLGTIPEARAKPSKLEQLSGFSADYVRRILNKQPIAPSQPVPNLSEIKPIHIELPQSTQRYVTLPPAPQQLTSSLPNIKPIDLHPPIEIPKYIVRPQKILMPSLNFLNKKPVSYALPRNFPKYMPLSNLWDDDKDEFEEFKTPPSFAIPKCVLDSYKNLKSQGSLLNRKPFYLNLPHNFSKYVPPSDPWDDEDEYGEY